MEAGPLVPSESVTPVGTAILIFIIRVIFQDKKCEVCNRRFHSCAFSLWFWREGGLLRTCQPFLSRARNQGTVKQRNQVLDFEKEDQSVHTVHKQTLSTPK